MILKRQKRFKSIRHNVFIEEINEIALSSNDGIALSSNDGKRLQLIDLVKMYAYRTSKTLLHKKEKIKCRNTKRQYKND